MTLSPPTTASTHPAPRAPIVCLSHLRWDFVFQRPQHLMTRLAAHRAVLYVEEPVETGGPPRLDTREVAPHVTVAVPRLPRALCAPGHPEGDRLQGGLLAPLVDRLETSAGQSAVVWYYTPMSIDIPLDIAGRAVVYDCMDALSHFRFAPPSLLEREAALLRRADLVFTGGFSLYEAKRALHPRVHAFPSSVDAAHFARARAMPPSDGQAPRIGYCGVIDERIDLELLAQVAALRPDWQWIMLGPVVKIDPAALPRAANLHYVGGRPYDDLPDCLGTWDAAMMPFALNDATRFISPTKTPEYLAAGLAVASTPVADVVRSWGASGLVHIGDGAGAFVRAVEAAVADGARGADLIAQADRLLENMSWDRTVADMDRLIERHLASGFAAVAILDPRAPRHEPAAVMDDLILDPPPVEAPSVDRDGAFDYLIVGAGFAGCVLAERLASQRDLRVLLLDRRPHIGGNAYDHYNEDGLLIHRYGPHIFHTNSQRVVDYLSQFTAWRPYEHRVLASVDGHLVPMPINLTTLNTLYGLKLDPAAAAAFLASKAEPVADIRTSRDVVINQIGRELYGKFFEGYTRKQWGLDPSQLDKSVTSRVPTRTDTDDRYFLDSLQMMPRDGYTRMFERMVDHPNISVMLNTDFREVRRLLPYRHLVYTGPVDEFFDHRFGRLPYRSLAFRHETHRVEQFQVVAVVNYPDEAVPYTRITEYKHLTGQRHPFTSISYETPTDIGDPYYPVPTPENAALYRRYEALVAATPGLHMTGRLGTYRYYNMDQVVAQSLALFERLSGESTAARNLPARV